MKLAGMCEYECFRRGKKTLKVPTGWIYAVQKSVYREIYGKTHAQRHGGQLVCVRGPAARADCLSPRIK